MGQKITLEELMDALVSPDRTAQRNELIQKLQMELRTEVAESLESIAWYRLGAVLLELLLEEEIAAVMMHIPDSPLKRYAREMIRPQILEFAESAQEIILILLNLLGWVTASILISKGAEAQPAY